MNSIFTKCNPSLFKSQAFSRTRHLAIRVSYCRKYSKSSRASSGSSADSNQTTKKGSTKEPKGPFPLFWVDIETTGIDVKENKILELAMVVTDNNLNIIDKGLNLVFFQPPEVLQALDPWCQFTHRKNNLINEVSESKLTLKDGEQLVLELVKKYCPVPKRAIIAGNSVQFDQSFMNDKMPELAEYLHFRILDVSTVNELGKRWAPVSTALYGSKLSKHRAMSDIIESINELKYYRETIFDKNSH
ncbi:hypothetical protein BB560_007110 [Smittium megazygosporum]|uniref:Exonuclease domain-containing protein n=1 Tax=Smittium megazygosporum TaxID=133381 RepID=A0A2T9XYT3_9FUNG|nr:hypothetical protein BB560_007110 [Smittium megazygosporum]